MPRASRSALPPVLILHNVPLVEDLERTGPAAAVGRGARAGAAPARRGKVHLESDAGVLAQVAAVATALSRLKVPHRVLPLRRLDELPDLLRAAREPVVFNLVEALRGPADHVNLVSAVCRAHGKECTGGDTPCLALTLDKARTKAVLRAANLPCPPGVVVPLGARVPRSGLPAGRLIVKPLAADAGEGIDPHSVVSGRGNELQRAVRQIHETMGQPALIEKFIDGREINVSIWEQQGEPETLPLAEIDFSRFSRAQPRIVGYTAKWREGAFEYENTDRMLPAKLPARLAERLRTLALAAWHACGCCDYARVDFRVSRRGEPYILEVNQSPDLAPDAGFPAALQAAGVPFHRFVAALVRNAAARREVFARAVETTAVSGGKRVPRRASSGRRAETAVRTTPHPVIRYTIPADRTRVLALLEGTRFFRPDELEVAAEVLDEALEAGAGGHYQSFAIELAGGAGGEVAGWICLGPSPCSLGAWDVYWLGVAAEHQGQGLGQALLRHAEALISKRGGYLSVIETSGSPGYDSTRGFYLKAGYVEAARLRDFYAPGDDRVIYTKDLRRT